MVMLTFEKYANGWSLGRNNRRSFYLSCTRWDKGPKFEFEWHNYARINSTYRTDTHFVSVGFAKHSFTLWVPDWFLKPVLDRVPAYVHRTY